MKFEYALCIIYFIENAKYKFEITLSMKKKSKYLPFEVFGEKKFISIKILWF